MIVVLGEVVEGVLEFPDESGQGRAVGDRGAVRSYHGKNEQRSEKKSFGKKLKISNLNENINIEESHYFTRHMSTFKHIIHLRYPHN